MEKELQIPIAIIVEQRASQHAWCDTVFSVSDIILHPVSTEPWTVLAKEKGLVRYNAGITNLCLHYKETEAYKFNLESAEPSLFVVMREPDNTDNEDDYPLDLLLVSASPYDAQDYDDVGDIVDRVPLPKDLHNLISKFLTVHHKEEKFIKRKRDKVNVEEHKFGKDPIFNKLLSRNQ